MIKRTPKNLQASDKEFEIIKDELAKYGIGIIKNEEWNQFEVYEIGNKSKGLIYYSIDIKDRDLKLAFENGMKMAKKLGHKRQNPKCKTIEVRRKIRILGKPRVVKVKRKICNPELDLARLERSLVHELIEYDKKLTAKDLNIYRMGHYLKAVERAFGDLKQIDDPTLQDVKESISQRFDPQLPPVKKFLKKHT